VDKNKKTFTLAALADRLGLTIEGDPDTCVSGIATLASASADQLSFYHNSKFHSDLKATRAGAVIVAPDAVADCPVDKLVTDNPYLAYARASQLFAAGESYDPGVHPSAVVHATAVLGRNVNIAANTVVEANAEIGDDCVIGANSVIGSGCSIGQLSSLHANVVLYPNVHIGRRAIIHAGAVIGCDGFGFARDGAKSVKIEQLGGVRIGDDVEVGACTTIDRGALEDTVIEDGVKLDNQVQIAHNVRVGENTIVCGCSAIAGSSTVGKNCIIAGAVGIINHVNIADGVTVTAMSLVNKSITTKGVYSSGTGLSESALWKKNIVHFRKLDELASRLKALEKELEHLKGGKK
jgi:UDP-3-O-[3-hydroxymyristoyl] glucosamine N-acyltransferase